MAKGEEKPKRFVLHLKPLQGVLESFCRRNLYDASSVEDVLQEAITRAYRDFDLFSEGTNFRAWIFRYVNLVILEANRHRAGCDEQLVEEAEVNSEADEDWELSPDSSLLQMLLGSPEVVLEQCGNELNRAIRSLRSLDRTVLLLRSIGEFKYREIAEIIGIPMGTVMSSLSRARQQVRHKLSKQIKQSSPNHTDGPDREVAS